MENSHEREPYETLGGIYDSGCCFEYLEGLLDDLEISFDSFYFVGSVKGYNSELVILFSVKFISSNI
jgi:hypothetical protein